jgi:hypothetical protein
MTWSRQGRRAPPKFKAQSTVARRGGRIPVFIAAMKSPRQKLFRNFKLQNPNLSRRRWGGFEA